MGLRRLGCLAGPVIVRVRFGLVRHRASVCRHGNLLKVVQRSFGGVALEEDVALEPPREGHGELIHGKLARRDAKDPVQLLERTLHGFWHPEENHDKGDHVESGIQAEGAYRVELVEQERKRDAQDSGLWVVVLANVAHAKPHKAGDIPRTDRWQQQIPCPSHDEKEGTPQHCR